MGYERYTRTVADEELVTTIEMQDYLKVDETEDTILIHRLLSGWTDWAKGYTWSSFKEETWRLDMEEWSAEVVLRRNPVKSVDQIQYYDTADTLQVLAATEYTVYQEVPARVVIDTFPSLADRPDAVQITFKTENLEILPIARIGIMSLVALQHLQREDFKPDGPYISMAKRLFSAYRLNYY